MPINPRIKNCIEALKASPDYTANPGVKAAIDSAIPDLEVAVSRADLEPIFKVLRFKIRQAKGIEEPHHAELKEFIGNQFETAVDTAKIFQEQAHEKDPEIPSQEKLIEAILPHISEIQWQEIQKFKKHTLLLVPIANLERYEKALNSPQCKTQDGQQDACVYDWCNQWFTEKEQQIKGYRWAIVDGAEDLTDPESPYNKKETIKNENRIKAFEKAMEGKKIEGMDYESYAILMMKALKGGSPLDKSTYSILTKVQKDGVAACGDWYDYGVNLSVVNLSSDRNNARVRPAVMGNLGL